jgi:ParB family chromosome partitioning protein
MSAPLAVLMLWVHELVPNVSQPRKTFDREELARMTANVAARGILQPIRVRRNGRDCWEIIAGECRWLAAKAAGLEQVPCLPVEGDLDEAELLIDQISENEIRNSLRPLELARGIAKVKALKGVNSRTLAKMFGWSGSGVCIAEALLTLPDDLQQMVDDGRLAETTAYEISRVPGPEGQRKLALKVVSKSLTREQTQEEVRNEVPKKNVAAKAGRLSCKLSGGLSITVSKGGQPLSKADINAAIERLRKEMKKFEDKGDKPVLAVSLTDLPTLTESEPSS